MGAFDISDRHPGRSYQPALRTAAAAVLWFVAGLALTRLLYEGLFPTWGWIGRPVPAIGVAMVTAALGGVLAWRYRLQPVVAVPLLINLIWLVDPATELSRSRFLFAASLWLVAVLVVWQAIGDRDQRWRWLGPLVVAAGLLPVYLLTMSSAVGAADTFEFQVVTPQLGIAHPTGYPLYLLLGKLFSLLPFGTMAWRINLASVVYAVAAAAVVFRIAYQLTRRALPALLGATVLGLVPIFWSQAIIAEVYTLHAFIVATALLLMIRLVMGEERPATAGGPRPAAGERKMMVTLSFIMGLGLTNHLTTVFLLPPASLTLAFVLWPTLAHRRKTADGRIIRRRSLVPLLFQLALAFTVPLLLYAYLPWRWSAVNDEPMGLARFVDWVAAGRFQGALQWDAWGRDATRWQIIGRLLLDAWGWTYLVLALGGLIGLCVRQWRGAAILLLTAAGFTFYALNYYVPDLAVFLIPTHVVVAIWVGAGAGGLLDLMNGQSPHRAFLRDHPTTIAALVFIIALLPALVNAGDRWQAVDQSGHDGGEPWARSVLALPLARGAAVLADSEKIAPLYYLQQIERLRPDLDIMVLPDEATYRAELDERLVNGQVVYLARYLPGLEGVYHLRSAGPLVEVSREPLSELPENASEAQLSFGPLRLAGYRLDPFPASDPAITLFWTLDSPSPVVGETPVLYTRWLNVETGVEEMIAAGHHLVANNYPANAMRPAEIVPDFHALSEPGHVCGNPAGCTLAFQVAVAPRFTATQELHWQTITTLPVLVRTGPAGEARRAYLQGFALDGIATTGEMNAAGTMPIIFSGFGEGDSLLFLLVPPHAVSSFVFPATAAPEMGGLAEPSVVYGTDVEPSTASNSLALVAMPQGEQRAVCGWLALPTTGCVLAKIEPRGMVLPDGATNFDGRLALVDFEVDESGLVPGGQLPVTLTWQGLADLTEDYTMFVQVLDAADRIVGQVDAWPVQGTRPTSTWRPGETVVDPYRIQLSAEMPPGSYRVIAGLYLLATGQRLPVVDDAGNPIADRVETAVVLEQAQE